MGNKSSKPKRFAAASAEPSGQPSRFQRLTLENLSRVYQRKLDTTQRRLKPAALPNDDYHLSASSSPASTAAQAKKEEKTNPNLLYQATFLHPLPPEWNQNRANVVGITGGKIVYSMANSDLYDKTVSDLWSCPIASSPDKAVTGIWNPLPPQTTRYMVRDEVVDITHHHPVDGITATWTNIAGDEIIGKYCFTLNMLRLEAGHAVYYNPEPDDNDEGLILYGRILLQKERLIRPFIVRLPRIVSSNHRSDEKIPATVVYSSTDYQNNKLFLAFDKKNEAISFDPYGRSRLDSIDPSCDADHPIISSYCCNLAPKRQHAILAIVGISPMSKEINVLLKYCPQNNTTGPWAVFDSSIEWPFDVGGHVDFSVPAIEFCSWISDREFLIRDSSHGQYNYTRHEISAEGDTVITTAQVSAVDYYTSVERYPSCLQRTEIILAADQKTKQLKTTLLYISAFPPVDPELPRSLFPLLLSWLIHSLVKIVVDYVVAPNPLKSKSIRWQPVFFGENGALPAADHADSTNNNTPSREM